MFVSTGFFEGGAAGGGAGSVFGEPKHILILRLIVLERLSQENLLLNAAHLSILDRDIVHLLEGIE
jgi:hypothetical protein